MKSAVISAVFILIGSLAAPCVAQMSRAVVPGTAAFGARVGGFPTVTESAGWNVHNAMMTLAYDTDGLPSLYKTLTDIHPGVEAQRQIFAPIVQYMEDHYAETFERPWPRSRGSDPRRPLLIEAINNAPDVAVAKAEECRSEADAALEKVRELTAAGSASEETMSEVDRLMSEADGFIRAMDRLGREFSLYYQQKEGATEALQASRARLSAAYGELKSQGVADLMRRTAEALRQNKADPAVDPARRESAAPRAQDLLREAVNLSNTLINVVYDEGLVARLIELTRGAPDEPRHRIVALALTDTLETLRDEDAAVRLSLLIALQGLAGRTPYASVTKDIVESILQSAADSFDPDYRLPALRTAASVAVASKDKSVHKAALLRMGVILTTFSRQSDAFAEVERMMADIYQASQGLDRSAVDKIPPFQASLNGPGKSPGK
ncbi:MAG TPA: hypothetical protein DEB40_12360 [Elusimicrobia bacterium]|nr:hypothetical protein [Elusimicrobiota bacterium]HBT62527.1 hypothetical protein [Elusimicrobiota bacterium]